MKSSSATKKQESNWDEKYRERADRVVFGKESRKAEMRVLAEEEEKEEEERKRRLLAKAMLQAALERDEEEEEEVNEEDQKSLAVGIIGPPNAGKSALTNYMVLYFFSPSFLFPLFLVCIVVYLMSMIILFNLIDY